MNSSLAPNDTLGRMLHTFSSTAYEVADWNFNNLKEHHLIDVPTEKKAVLRIGQVIPTGILESYSEGSFLNKYPGFTISNDRKTIYFPQSYSISITEAWPGKMFQLHVS